MSGIVIFTSDLLKLFVKVFPYNFKYKANTKKKVRNVKSKQQKGQIITIPSQNAQKKDCFVFADKAGKIIAINEEFQKYFSLSFNVMKKYKINIFKDLLKIENTKNKGFIKKDWYEIFENIAQLNLSLMQNSTNDEFSKTFRNIKEIQKAIFQKHKECWMICHWEERELPKSDVNLKEYYFISFSIEVNNISVTFDEFLRNEVNKYPLWASARNLEERRESINNNILSLKYCPINASKLQKRFLLNKNLNEVILKFNQIQILSLKYVTLNYGWKAKEILNLSKQGELELDAFYQQIEKDCCTITWNTKGNYSNTNNNANSMNSTLNTNSSMNLNSNTANWVVKRRRSVLNWDNRVKIKANDQKPQMYETITKANISEKIKKTIMLQLLIWVFFSAIFLILQFVIILLVRVNETQIYRFNDLIINILMIKSMLYSIVVSVLRLQYKSNGWIIDKTTPDIIDNDFDNSVTYNQWRIVERLNDYLNYLKAFEIKENILFEYRKIELLDWWNEIHQFIDISKSNCTANLSTYQALSMIHWCTNLLIYNDPPIIDYTVPSYQDIPNRELLKVNSTYIFIIENFITTLRFPLDEVGDLLWKYINEDVKYILFIIYGINISNGLWLLLIFFMQCFIYNKINNQIFGKYFFAYNYIQFFNVWWLRKWAIWNSFLNNGDVTMIQSFSKNRVEINVNNEDEKLFKENFERIGNGQPLWIKAFKVKDNTESGKESENQGNVYNHSVINGISNYSDLKDGCSDKSVRIINNNRDPKLTDSFIKGSAWLQSKDSIRKSKLEESGNRLNSPVLDNHWNFQDLVIINQKSGAANRNPKKSIPQIKSVQFKDNYKLGVFNSPNDSNSPYHIANTSASPNKINSFSNQITSNNFLMSKRPLITPQYNENWMLNSNNYRSRIKKELRKPRSFLLNLVTFSVTSLSIVIFCVIDALIMHASFKSRLNSSEIIKYMLKENTKHQEVVLTYGITLLKRKRIIYTYKSKGYLTNLPSLSYLNTETEHDIWRESIDESLIYNDKIKDLIESHRTEYPTLYSYYHSLYSDDSCDFYYTFYETNQDWFNYDTWSSLNSAKYPQSSWIGQCKSIGKGWNMNGIATTTQGILNTINNYYNDFLDLDSWTPEIIFKRATDPWFSSFLVQVDLIQDKAFINLWLAWTMDYNNSNSYHETTTYIIFGIIVFLALVINFFYIWQFTLKFRQQNKVIDLIEPRIINNIMF